MPYDFHPIRGAKSVKDAEDNKFMDNTACTKEYLERFCQALSRVLPEWFRLYSKLLVMTNPKTHEIDCCLNDLAKAPNYNRYVLYSSLSCLAELQFIKFRRSCDFHQKIKIKILVCY